jgi:hypothetical protein
MTEQSGMTYDRWIREAESRPYGWGMPDFNPNEEESARSSLIEQRLAEIEQERESIPSGVGTRAEIQKNLDALDEEEKKLDQALDVLHEEVLTRQDSEQKQKQVIAQQTFAKFQSDIKRYQNELLLDFERYKGESATAKEKSDVYDIAERYALGRKAVPGTAAGALILREPLISDWAKRELPTYTGVQRTGMGINRSYIDPDRPEGVPPMKKPFIGPLPPVRDRQIAGQIAETQQIIKELQDADAPPQTISILTAELLSLQRISGVAAPLVSADPESVSISEYQRLEEEIARSFLATMYDAAFTGQEPAVQRGQINHFLNVAVASIGEELEEASNIEILSALYAMFDPENAIEETKALVETLVDSKEFNVALTDIEAQISEEFLISYGILSLSLQQSEPNVQTVLDNLISELKKAGEFPAVLTESQRRYLGNLAQSIAQQARIDGIDAEGLDLGTYILASWDGTSQAAANIIQQGGLTSVVQEALAKEYLATQPLNIQFETLTNTQLKTGKETRTEQDMANEQGFQMFQSQIQQARLRGLDPDMAQIAQQSMEQVSAQMRRFRGEDLQQVTDAQRQRIATGQAAYQPVPSQALTGPIGGMFANLWSQYQERKDANIRNYIEEQSKVSEEEKPTYEEAEKALGYVPVAPEPSRFDKEEAAVKERGRQEEIDEYIRINTPDRGVTEEEALRPFEQDRPEGESDAAYNRRRDEALATVTQATPGQVAPTEAGAKTALSGMNIFKEDYTMPGFREPEPDIVPTTTPPPPGLAGTTRRRRRLIT